MAFDKRVSKELSVGTYLWPISQEFWSFCKFDLRQRSLKDAEQETYYATIYESEGIVGRPVMDYNDYTDQILHK